MREAEAYRTRVEAKAREQGIDLVGIADLTGERPAVHHLPPDLVAVFDRAVCLAVRVSPTVLATVRDGPNHLYYHHYRQLNFLLDRAALAVAREIEALGYRALAVAASQIIDWTHQLGHVSHKDVARLGGLGWRGRNNLLVTPAYGAQVRLVTVLTDLPLEPASPLGQDCGACRRCLAVCPAGAIHEQPTAFDHQACFAKLKEFGKTRGIGQYICGLCVAACPGRATSGREF